MGRCRLSNQSITSLQTGKELITRNRFQTTCLKYKLSLKLSDIADDLVVLSNDYAKIWFIPEERDNNRKTLDDGLKYHPFEETADEYVHRN